MTNSCSVGKERRDVPGAEMKPTPELKASRWYSIEQNNEAFGKRLRAINRSQEGKAALKAMRDAQQWFREQYRLAALAHWQERGNGASTGWGCTPEQPYSEKLKPADCAVRLADKLARYLGQDPFSPPGR